MDLSNLGYDLVFVLAFVLVGWYVVGTLRQRRLIRAYVTTLGKAAESLAAPGMKPTIKWLGQSGFQIVVGDATAPFRRLSFVTLLSPRELLLAWLWNVARRRGDLVVIRADLRDAPPRARDLEPPDGARKLSVTRESPHLLLEMDGRRALGASLPDLVREAAARAS